MKLTVKATPGRNCYSFDPEWVEALILYLKSAGWAVTRGKLSEPAISLTITDPTFIEQRKFEAYVESLGYKLTFEKRIKVKNYGSNQAHPTWWVRYLVEPKNT